MRTLMLSIAAASLAVPVSFAIPGGTTVAEAKAKRNYYRSTAKAKRCRPSKGNAGLIAGGVAGGVVGHEVIGHGLLGVGAGVVGGAIAGRAIDRTITAKKRCR